MDHLSELEAAYLAGLIDGEGSIILSQRPCRGNAPHQATPLVCVTNTNREMLEYAHQKIGVGHLTTSPRSSGWKHSYQLVVCANGVRQLLPRLRPYLVAKKLQADLLMEYLSLVNGKKGVPVEKRERASAICQEVRALNARGDERNTEAWSCAVEGCTERAYREHPWCHRHWQKFGVKPKGECEHCGKEMEIGHVGKKYCSPPCAAAAYHLQVVRPRMDAEQQAREKPPCPVCGNPVDRSKRAGRRYCSEKCQMAAYNATRGQPTVLAETDGSELLTKTCPCGTQFQGMYSHRIYCDACRKERMRADWRASKQRREALQPHGQEGGVGG